MRHIYNKVKYTLFVVLFIFSSRMEANLSPIQSQIDFDGFFPGFINTIFQGKNALWVGSENGLIQITGRHIDIYSSENGYLPSNEINSVFEDELGILWLATSKSGLLAFNPNTKKRIDISSITSSLHPICWDIIARSASLIYVSCYNRILQINTRNLTSETFSFIDEQTNKPMDKIYELQVDTEGDIWFSRYPGHIFKYEVENKVLRKFNAKNSNFVGNETTSIVFDLEKNLWVSTDLGLNKMAAGSLSFEHFPVTTKETTSSSENNVWDMFRRTDGSLWLAANSVLTFTPNENRRILSKPSMFYPHLANNKIQITTSLSENQGNAIFIGSTLNGLSVVPEIGKAIHYVNDFKNETLIVDKIKPIDESTLIASEQGIFLYQTSEKKLTKVNESIGIVEDILELEKNIFLLITDAHEDYKYNHSKRQVTPYNAVTNITTSLDKFEIDTVIKGDGTFYWGVDEGKKSNLYKGDFNSGLTLEISHIRSEFLIHSNLGIYFLNHPTDSVGILDKKGEVSLQTFTAKSAPIEPICFRKLTAELIFICTKTKGLGIFNLSEGKIAYVDIEKTANSKVIRDVQRDDEGYYWISTNKGLVRYDLESNKSIKLGSVDGIIDKDFDSKVSKNIGQNLLFISGDKTNYIIDTKLANLYLNKRLQLTTQTQLVEMHVSNKNMQEQKDESVLLSSALLTNQEFTLEYTDYLFSIKMAANNFLEKDNLNFEYRLLGLSEEWTPAQKGADTATFSTLPHGHYEFQTRVIDSKSHRPQPITKLAISVRPPWWKTWQAYSFYILGLIASVYMMYLWRTRQLRKSNLELEHKVTVRTRELRESNQSIAKLLEQKQSFFANVSHELRTPLSLILGPLESIFENQTDPQKKNQLALINRNARRLTLLVDQMLELAKLETSKNIPKRHYDLGKSISLITNAFIPLMENKEQRLIINIGNLGSGEYLEDTLEKIIVNLLSNATKYSQRGTNITFEATIEKNSLILRVIDEGPGIPLEFQDKIFDRFVRVQGSESKPGSGIGLALVKELVEANNGNIQVFSDEGKGSQFVVKLPILTIENNDKSLFVSDTLKLHEETEETEYVIQNHHSEKLEQTILIVEDNADMRAFLWESLKAHYNCILAIDGQSGLEQAIAAIPDIILSDVMMPKLTGFEMAQCIRKHELTCHIPIVLLTAKGDQNSRMQGWQVEIDDYIAKPLSIKELQLRLSRLTAIRNILKRRFARNIEESIENPQEAPPQMKFNNQSDEAFYEKFLNCIERHYTKEDFSREEASSYMALSERQLNRKLKGLIEYNFSEYLRRYRLAKAQELLREGWQISKISYEVGFSSLSYFSRCYKAEYGESPKAFVDKLKSSN